MLSGEAAYERACLFASMSGVRFVPTEAEIAHAGSDVSHRVRDHAAWDEDRKLWLVFFPMLPIPGSTIDPDFCVVEVDPMTENCSFGVVM